MENDFLKRFAQGFSNKPQDQRPSVEMVAISKMLQDLTEVPQEAFGAYAFSREPLRSRIPLEKRMELTHKAIDCGQSCAKKIREKYGDLSPRGIAGKLGLKLKFPQKPLHGGHVTFAQFVAPDEITVFMDCVDKAEELIREEALGSILKKLVVEEVLIAHELFHYLEEENEKTIFTRTEKLELWKIGKLKNTSRIVCLGEIAGMAFAKELAKLSFSPYVLDSFFVYLYDKQAGCYLYHEMMRLIKEWMGLETKE